MNYSTAEIKIIKRNYQASIESMGWQLLIGKSCMSILYKADDMWERWQTEDGFVVPPNYPRNKKKDLSILKRLNVDFVYLPNAKDIYDYKRTKKIQ